MSVAFDWNIRVYYEDTDAGGIVFYANYLKFFERARTEWLRHAGINQRELADSDGAMFVVKTVELDYRRPARMDDQLAVTVAVEKLGRASMLFFQECRRGDEVLVTCRVKVGCVSTDGVAPLAIPAQALEAIRAAAGRSAKT
jgi:acyl-CoA thioester hydrolase